MIIFIMIMIRIIMFMRMIRITIISIRIILVMKIIASLIKMTITTISLISLMIMTGIVMIMIKMQNMGEAYCRTGSIPAKSIPVSKTRLSGLEAGMRGCGGRSWNWEMRGGVWGIR